MGTKLEAKRIEPGQNKKYMKESKKTVMLDVFGKIIPESDFLNIQEAKRQTASI